MAFLKTDDFLSRAMTRPAFFLPSLPGPEDLQAFEEEMELQLGHERVFVTAKVDVNDIASVKMLVNCGFSLVDTNIVYGRTLNDIAVASCKEQVRPAQSHDKQQIQDIARDNLTFNRFHLDPFIENQLAGDVKAAWAGNYFSGERGDAMLVIERDGRPVGFLQLLFSGSSLVIDLIAVDASVRRMGMARALIQRAASLYGNFEELLVGTQVANSGASRFYEALGFRLVSAKYVLHAHGGRLCA